MSESITAAFARHLAAFDDPGALYDTYAADAPLCVRFDVVPRRALGRDEFTALIAAGQRLAAKAGRPTASFSAPLLIAEHLEGDRALAWFNATELTDGREVTIAAGLLHEDHTWKVHFATLADAPAAWSYGMGLAQAVGELVYAEPANLRAARSWLDVACYRRFWKPRPPISTLPEARFSCQSSASCCRIGFQVDLPAGAQAVLDALPWEEFAPQHQGVQLPVLPGGRLQLKDHHQTCRFLDEHRHCSIHKALGRAVFPVCAGFPMRFTLTPDGVAVTTSSACGSARNNLGQALTERADEIYDRMAMRTHAPAPETFQLSPQLIVDWPTYQRAEAMLLAILEREDLSIIDRLWLGERHLHDLLHEPELPVIRPVADAIDRAEIRTYLASFDARLGVEPAGTPRPIACVRGMPQEQELLTMLRNTLFDKGYGFGADLLTAWHVLVFLAVTVLHLQSYDPEGTVPPRLLWRLASLFQHQTVFRSYAEDGEEAAMLWQEFGQAGFGPDLLSLPLPAPPHEAATGGWRQLGDDDLDGLTAFLEQDVLGNLDMLEAIARMRAAGQDFYRLFWYGWRQDGRWLAVTNTRGSLCFYAPEPAAEAEVAALLARRVVGADFLRGRDPAARRIGAMIKERVGPPAEEHEHVLQVFTRPEVPRPYDPAFRFATMADLERVLALDAAFMREETGQDVAADERFRQLTMQRIMEGRFMLLEEQGQILYQCLIGGAYGDTATLANTYTPPALRGRGFGKRGLAQACRLLHERFGQLLFIARVDNAVQLAVGRAVGFTEAEGRIRDLFWPR